MKRAIPITTLFLDIGGVLLTNGGTIVPAGGRRRVLGWIWPKWRIGTT